MTKQESKLWIKVYNTAIRRGLASKNPTLGLASDIAANLADKAVKQYRVSVTYFEDWDE